MVAPAPGLGDFLEMSMNKDPQATEELGKQIDSLDNLAHALQLPLPAQMHVEQLRKALPESVLEFKRLFAAVTGENPWE